MLGPINVVLNLLGWMEKMNTERTCRLIRSSRTNHGKQGFDYAEAILKESVGTKGICIHLLTFPPDKRAKAHLHQEHETVPSTLSWY